MFTHENVHVHKLFEFSDISETCQCSIAFSSDSSDYTRELRKMNMHPTVWQRFFGGTFSSLLPTALEVAGGYCDCADREEAPSYRAPE